jgi:integrase
MQDPKAVKNQIGILRQEFGHRFYDDITATDFKLWMKRLKDSERAVASIKLYLHHAKKIYEYATLEPDPKYRISINPLEKLRGPREKNNIRRYYVPPKCFERYLEWFKKFDPDFYPFYAAMFLTGRRPTEISKWTWDRIDQEEQIYENDDGTTFKIHFIDIASRWAKNGVQDILYFPERLWSIIFAQGWRSGLVFRNPHQRCLDQQWKKWQWGDHVHRLKKAFPDDPICQKMWARDTRRGFATYHLEYAEELLDSKVVQQLIGHANPASTDKYRVPNRNRVIQAVFPGLKKKGTKNAHVTGTDG